MLHQQNCQFEPFACMIDSALNEWVTADPSARDTQTLRCVQTTCKFLNSFEVGRVLLVLHM
jgi:hypothetical protein